jgi:hypothetical protein
MILQIGRVNSLVAHRAHLLRQGDDKGEAGWSVRRRAQEMVDELGGGLERDSGKVIFELPDPSAGKASRVCRGTNVSRGVDEDRSEANSLPGHSARIAHHRAVRDPTSGFGRLSSPTGAGERTGNGGRQRSERDGGIQLGIDGRSRDGWTCPSQLPFPH